MSDPFAKGVILELGIKIKVKGLKLQVRVTLKTFNFANLAPTKINQQYLKLIKSIKFLD